MDEFWEEVFDGVLADGMSMGAFGGEVRVCEDENGCIPCAIDVARDGGPAAYLAALEPAKE